MRPSIRATGRVMQRWMGQAVKEQAKMIRIVMVKVSVESEWEHSTRAGGAKRRWSLAYAAQDDARGSEWPRRGAKRRSFLNDA